MNKRKPVIKLFKGATLFEGADICNKHKLYEKYGDLRGEYINILGVQNRFRNRYKLLMIAYYDDKPVGCSLVLCGEIWLYTKFRQRRRGIGTAMYKRAMRHFNRQRNFSVVKDGDNEKFFDKVQKRK